jgi:hypothetical protein
MRQHTLTVWSVAIDSDFPLTSNVYTRERSAWSEVVEHFCGDIDGTEKAFELLEANNFVGLRYFLNNLIKESHNNSAPIIDSYTVDKHEITVEVPGPSDKGVSEDERDHSVTVTADVKADFPEESTKEFVKSLQIGNTDGLIFQVSNLKTGAYTEIDS